MKIKKSVKLSLMALGFLAFIPLASMAAENNSYLGFGNGGGNNRLGGDNKGTMKSMSVEEREAFLADRDARMEKINLALESGDYNAWLEVVGSDCPLAEKITSENFSEFVEAHKLMNQAREKFESLGIERGVGIHGDFGGRGNMINK